MKKIKAIKIDVVKKSVYEVYIEPNIDGLHKGVEADCVERIRLNLKGRDDLYIDESGVLREPQLPNFVLDKDTVYETVPLAGHGLITGAEKGSEEDDYITDCTSTVAEIWARVTFGDEVIIPRPHVILTGQEAEDWLKNQFNF